jgi:hypothetical protein
MAEKYWTFILNLDEMSTTVIEGDKEPPEVWHLKKICQLIGDYFGMHRWFMETIDTPLLSMDSTYEIILDKKMTIVENWKEFIESCDMVFAEVA